MPKCYNRVTVPFKLSLQLVRDSPRSRVVLHGEVLARRGHCTFVQKTRTVQKAGAVGLVVINAEDRVQVMTALSGSSAEVRGELCCHGAFFSKFLRCSR